MALAAVTFLLTFVVNVAVCLVMLFFMLLGMNGYSESEATYGIGTFAAAGLAVSLLCSVLAVKFIRYLTHIKHRGRVFASLIAVPGFVFVGTLVNFAAMLAGVLVAEMVRNHS
jgi:hypothetical protein